MTGGQVPTTTKKSIVVRRYPTAGSAYDGNERSGTHSNADGYAKETCANIIGTCKYVATMHVTNCKDWIICFLSIAIFVSPLFKFVISRNSK